MRAFAAVAGLALLGAIAPCARAHPLAPSLLELRESAGGIDVLWKTPLVRVTGAELLPRVGASDATCRRLAPVATAVDAGGATARWRVDCGPDGATGLRVAVEGLERSRTDAIVRVAFADGRRFASVLSAASPALVVPGAGSAPELAADYVALGFGHILGGLEHLLFVFGLLLLVRGARPLLATVTAFTAGHSVTLSLAVLGWVDYPTRLVEIAIAGSLVALAVEISANRAPGVRSRTWLGRNPWAMALGFGLLHGFGFAGALRQVGLPAGDVPLALATFNIGIELGQLAFVAGVYALRAGLAPLSRFAPAGFARGPLLASYAIGSLAVYWCFDRAAALM